MITAMTSMQRIAAPREIGASMVEVLFAMVVSVTLTSLAIPLVRGTLDELGTRMAARYVAGRVASSRIEAVRRSKAVALRFQAVSGDYIYASFGDGNGNGVRSAEIGQGIDPALGPFERLSDKFPGVRFELGPGVPDADGDAGTGQDGVRIGSARLLTMSADGTATSGTLYIRGRRGQYAVRVLGATGRTRVLQYLPAGRTWIAR